jgi:small basic protein
MNVGRLLGLAILSLLDAIAAGVLAGLFAWFALPIVWVSTRVELAVLACGLVAGAVLAIGLALVGLGKRPFPATRTVKAVGRRLPMWY